MGNLCLCCSPKRAAYVRDVTREWEKEFNMINMPYKNCLYVKAYFDQMKVNPMHVYVLYGSILQWWGISDAPYIARIFAQYDIHGTGRISFRTFLLVCWNITTLDKHLMECFMFELYDDDHDGYLPTAAISQMINDIYGSDAVSSHTVQEAERELKQIGQYTLTDFVDFRKFLHDHEHLFDKVMAFRDKIISKTTNEEHADFWMWQEQWRKAHCHVNKKEYMRIRELLGKPPDTTEADDEVNEEEVEKKKMEDRLAQMKETEKPAAEVHPDPNANEDSISHSGVFKVNVIQYKGTMGEIKAASNAMPDRESKIMADNRVEDKASGFKMPGNISDTSIAPTVRLIAPPQSTNWHPKKAGHEHEEHHHHHHHHHHHRHDKHDHGGETGNTIAAVSTSALASGGGGESRSHHSHHHTHDAKGAIRSPHQSGATSPAAVASPVGSPQQPHKRFGYKRVDVNEGKEDNVPNEKDEHVQHRHHHKKSTLAAEKEGKVKPEHGVTVEKADTATPSLHLSDSAAKYAAAHSYHKEENTAASVAEDGSRSGDRHEHKHKHHHGDPVGAAPGAAENVKENEGYGYTL